MKKWDFIIIALLMAISFVPYVYKLSLSDDPNGLYAQISIDGKIVDTIELNDPSFEKTFTYESELGTNKIEVSDSSIRVIESTCFDHVCEQTFPAHLNGDVIVCLPNNFLIEIKGDTVRDDIDIVSH